MLHMAVLFALLRTFFANIRAQLAELRRSLATACHHDGGSAADLCAFEVERNAAGEHFDVLLIQTGGRAVLTLDCAFIAGIYAATHGFVCHGGHLQFV